MSSGPKKTSHLPAEDAALRVSGLAIKVVAKLVAGVAPAERQLRDGVVDKLLAAVLSADSNAFATLKPELRRARITPAMLADTYIPEVARRLGQGWQDDCMSFADVSIGAARLQAILREIGASWSADERSDGLSTTVLVIVPANEQHTLGAMVLVSQLRRRGVSVCLRFGPGGEELRVLLQSRLFDGVMISLSTEDKVSAVALLVANIRKAAPRQILVALGGALMQPPADILARTGVDLVTNDLDAVLRSMRPVAASLTLLESL
jgi:methylmalonyl-CoA mutase cobalamin-binding subunit